MVLRQKIAWLPAILLVLAQSSTSLCWAENSAADVTGEPQKNDQAAADSTPSGEQNLLVPEKPRLDTAAPPASMIPEFGKPLPAVPANTTPDSNGQDWTTTPRASSTMPSPIENRVSRLEQVAFGATYPEHDLADRVGHLEEEILKTPGSGPLDGRISKLEAKVFGGAFGGSTAYAPANEANEAAPDPTASDSALSSSANPSLHAADASSAPETNVPGLKPLPQAQSSPALAARQNTAQIKPLTDYPVDEKAKPKQQNNADRGAAPYVAAAQPQSTWSGPAYYGAPYRPSAYNYGPSPSGYGATYQGPPANYQPNNYQPSYYQPSYYQTNNYQPNNFGPVASLGGAPPYVASTNSYNANSNGRLPLPTQSPVPIAGAAGSASERVAAAIPYDAKAGDYFAAIRSFAGDTFGRWQTFPVAIHLPENSPESWRRSLESGVRKWALYVPIVISKGTDCDIDVKWVNDLPIRIFGVTRWEGTGEHLKITVYALRPTFYPAEVPETTLSPIFLHEMGHALGILGHSSNVNDVMYATDDKNGKKAAVKRVNNLSARDLNTLKKLYSSPPLVPAYQFPHPLEYSGKI